MTTAKKQIFVNNEEKHSEKILLTDKKTNEVVVLGHTSPF